MTGIDKDAVQKVEAEIKAAEDARRNEERANAVKIAEDAAKRGKEEALKEFEAEQEKKRLAEENKKLMVRVQSLEEETKKQVADAEKRFLEQLEILKSERRGIAKNESPFNQTSTTTPPALDIKSVNERSMEEFARAHGFRFSNG